MGKKNEVEKVESSSDEDYDDEDLDSQDDQVDAQQSVDSDLVIAARDEAENPESQVVEKFGLKAINDEEGMTERLKEVQQNFYNRLESKKLIKKQGKIPFTEHMTISKYLSLWI